MCGPLAIVVQGCTAGTRGLRQETRPKTKVSLRKERRKREKSKKQMFAMAIISRFSIDFCCCLSHFLTPKNFFSLKVEVFSQWNELERTTSYTGEQDTKERQQSWSFTVNSEQGHRLGSPAWRSCSPEHTRAHRLHLEEQRSPYTLGILSSQRKTEQLHILLLRGSSKSVSF